MRNLTITVDEEVAHWARVWAAKHDTSVSKLVGMLLRRRMLEERGYAAAMGEYLATEPIALKRGGSYPDREALHDRSSIR